MRDTEREGEREAETQAEGEAGSMQGARHGTRSRVSRIAPWAKGRRQTSVPPRDPLSLSIILKTYYVIFFFNLEFWAAPVALGRLQPRVGSWRPGIESHIGLPTWSLLLPLPVSLPLSVSLFVCLS